MESHPGKIVNVLLLCGICDTVQWVHGEGHMPTIVPNQHHICPALWCRHDAFSG